MNIEQEIRDELDNIEQLKIDVGDINNHLSILEGLYRDRNQKEVDEAYQRGLNDAWECARKIALNRDEGGTSMRELTEIFGKYTLQQVFRGYTASEAIAKLKADDEIKVGDEVKLCAHKENYLVTSWEQDNHMCILMSVRGGFFRAEKCDVRKTGRHFNIKKILEEMKE